MTGHPQATALYGAPKLLWAACPHPNDNARAELCEQTRCGSYRRYRQGKDGNWSGVYLKEPPSLNSIFVEHTLEKLMGRIEAHHQRLHAASIAEWKPAA